MGIVTIRYNGYAGRQMLAGIVLGLLAGVLVYYVFVAPTVVGRDELAVKAGAATMFLAAAGLDLVERIRNGVNREGGVAVLHPDSGGNIWYIPMWLVGGLFGWLLVQ